MKLVVGIGNPGREYEGTRHNVGFQVLDRFAARERVEFRKQRFWNSLVAKAALGDVTVTLVKPLSFVNLSGPPARKAAADLSVAVEDVLVVLDDFALDLGRIRIRPGGSAGGHKGLDSVIRAFGTDRVARLRVGIGSPRPGGAVDHVLSRFRPDERDAAEQAMDEAALAVRAWAEEGVEAAMNRYNRSSSEDS